MSHPFSSDAGDAGEAILIPPCVADYRFNMGKEHFISVDDLSGNDESKQMFTTCNGKADPWCEGGTIVGGPDDTAKQVEFTNGMSQICTARCRYKRIAGITVSVELVDEQSDE